MPCAFAFFTSQFHACADGTSEETRKGDYKGNERVTPEGHSLCTSRGELQLKHSSPIWT
jgi:hypothetical protein